MEQIIIRGGKRLSGKVEVSGFKNAALPILVATVLVDGECVIENVPDISDVKILFEILSDMGAKIDRIDNCTYKINTENVVPGTSPYDLVRKMRGSIYLMGAEIGRFRHSRVGCPGGCDFGTRPIDQHIKALEALGACVKVEAGYVNSDAERLVGNTVYFDFVSVGATVNAILAAVLAEGVTVIENAAREPHIVDLANFLNSCGASISGAGTSVIKIRGVEELHGSCYDIIPDMIEAGTYMISAAITGGEVEVANVIPKHLESISAKLAEMGVYVEERDESVFIRGTRKLLPVNVSTQPYPGFPTDMHPQMSVLMCLANGNSNMTENIFNNRFKYVDELVRMGADISVNGKTAAIRGVNRFLGAPVRATDLRAGAAMIIAGLVAEGVTTISEISYIQRGYDDIVGKLRSLGADIELTGEIGKKFID